jgi:transposase-like protein
MPSDSAQIPLERVLAAVGQCLDRQRAESLLRLRADTEMQGRIDELADKCAEGRLTLEERDEYEAMIRAIRDGHLPEREVVSGVGPIRVRQPQVRLRHKGRFSSAILRKYMRRAPSVDALLQALYLKGISTGDFSAALTPILGEGPLGFRPGTKERIH